MKIFISYNVKNEAWGGGNQFLKNLRDKLLKMQQICNDPKDADIILFNSHHNLIKTLVYKIRYPYKKFVHRIDGPISSYRGEKEKKLDKLIYLFNSKISNGTIFLSKWSKEENIKKGYFANNNQVIYNAPDNKIFKEKKYSLDTQNRKIKIIASSWSENLLKGFDIFKYLDENLDFNKYQMTFVGNSKIQFKNIKMVKPVKSDLLYSYIESSDVFIFASKIESCSNLLMEAMATGIPVLVVDGTSNNEIFNSNGYIFKDKTDVINKLEKLVDNYEKLNLEKKYYLEDTIKKYNNFFRDIIKDKEKNKLSIIEILELTLKLFYFKIENKFIFWKKKF